jgi:hypothetical protein
VAESLEELAYEVASAGLQQQSALLDELRSRAGTLLTASAIVASFLGTAALTRAHPGWAGVLALLAFFTSIVCCVWILVPHQVTFTVSAPTLFETQYGQSTNEVHRRLAYWLDEYRLGNEPLIGRLFDAYRVGALAVVIQTVLWIAPFLHFP